MFVLHPVLRGISAVHGLRMKLGQVRDPAGCLDVLNGAVVQWNQLKEKLRCISTL